MKAGPLIGPNFVSLRLNLSLLALSASLSKRESSGWDAAEMIEKSDVAGVDELVEEETEADAIEEEFESITVSSDAVKDETVSFRVIKLRASSS